MDPFAIARKVRSAVQRVAKVVEMRNFRISNADLVSLCASTTHSETGR